MNRPNSTEDSAKDAESDAPDSGSSLERFKSLAKRLIRVPKTEVQEKERNNRDEDAHFISLPKSAVLIVSACSFLLGGFVTFIVIALLVGNRLSRHSSCLTKSATSRDGECPHHL